MSADSGGDALAQKTYPFDPDWCLSPGVLIREFMERDNLTPRLMALICGRMPDATMERLLTGKQRLTKDLAARLEAGTRVPARFWLNMERIYRVGLKAGKKDVSND